jgi:protein-tyrosine phosphatase
VCDSAGVGRTGTFISLDYLYEQATDSGRVDVLGCVRKLRQQRMDMVQREVCRAVFVIVLLSQCNM